MEVVNQTVSSEPPFFSVELPERSRFSVCSQHIFFLKAKTSPTRSPTDTAEPQCLIQGSIPTHAAALSSSSSWHWAAGVDDRAPAGWWPFVKERSTRRSSVLTVSARTLPEGRALLMTAQSIAVCPQSRPIKLTSVVGSLAPLPGGGSAWHGGMCRDHWLLRACRQDEMEKEVLLALIGREWWLLG